MFDKASYMNQYRIDNREAIRATATAWRRANPGRVKEHARRDRERNAATYRRYYQLHAEDLRERSRRAYWSDPETARAQRRAHYATHKNENRISHALYVTRNRERVLEAMRAWRETDAGRLSVRRSHALRRATECEASGDWTAEQFYARCEFYGWCCYLCGAELTIGTLTIEHRIPLSRGGSNWPANLAPACVSCNARKGTLTQFEYLARVVGDESEEELDALEARGITCVRVERVGEQEPLPA